MSKTIINSSEIQGEFISVLTENKVSVITADTGSGKTIMLPFLAMKLGKVVCSQPRVLMVHNAVSGVQEVNGFSCGYATAKGSDGLHKNLVFCTDGYAAVSQLISQCTVFFIDEIHEWNVNMEKLCNLLAKELHKRPEFKVVLLSATIEGELDTILNYFSEFSPTHKHYTGRQFPVQRIALGRTPEAAAIDYCSQGKSSMIFVDGETSQIELANKIALLKCDCEIILLSSKSDEATRKKLYTQGSKPRVWIATNVAQAGITPLYLDVVIHTGYKKQIMYKNGVEGLYQVKCSVSDIIQQAGRVGRMYEGIAEWCGVFSIDMCPAENTHEITRTNINHLVLDFASKGFDMSIEKFPHTPNLNFIKEAQASLVKYNLLDSDNKITPLGARVCRIPVEPKTALLIIGMTDNGYSFDEAALAVAIIENSNFLKVEYPATSNKEFTSLLVENDNLSTLCNLYRNVNVLRRLEGVKVFQTTLNLIRDKVEMLGKIRHSFGVCIKKVTRPSMSMILLKTYTKDIVCSSHVNFCNKALVYTGLPFAWGIPRAIEFETRRGRASREIFTTFVGISKENVIMSGITLETTTSVDFSYSTQSATTKKSLRFLGVELASETLTTKSKEEVDTFLNWWLNQMYSEYYHYNVAATKISDMSHGKYSCSVITKEDITKLVRDNSITSQEEWSKISPSKISPLDKVREEFPSYIGNTAVTRYVDRIVVMVYDLESISEVISDVDGIEVFYSYNDVEYTYSALLRLEDDLAIRLAMKEVINLPVEEVVSMDISSNSVKMLTDFSEYVKVVLDTELYPVVEATWNYGVKITFTTDKDECVQSVESYYTNVKDYVDSKYQRAVSYGLSYARLTNVPDLCTSELHDYLCEEYEYDGVTLYAGLSAQKWGAELLYHVKGFRTQKECKAEYDTIVALHQSMQPEPSDLALSLMAAFSSNRGGQRRKR